MRQGNSRQLFVHMLKTMLKGRGIHVNKLQLEKFFLFVEEVCPWFPEEGTVSLETWKKVGKQLQTYYSLHGPNRVPVFPCIVRKKTPGSKYSSTSGLSPRGG